MNWLDKIFKAVDHYRWTFISLLLGVATIGIGGASVGCESKTFSLLVPDKQITRTQLQIEVIEGKATLDGEAKAIEVALASHNAKVTAFNAKAEAAEADLDRKDEIRAQLLESIGAVATQAATGAFNPVSLIPMALGGLSLALGLGASADNRRKDKIIANGGSST